MKSCILILGILFSFNALASASYTLLDNKPILLAQAQNESYDPFADYSEFQETGDEEADINFFRNGRFFVLGFLVGQRMFTSKLATVKDPGVEFGFFISYFFNMRFALEFAYTTSSHNFGATISTGKATTTVGMNSLDINMKYFLNTQNLSRGLASFNPYVIGGIGSITRTNGDAATFEFASESLIGARFGGGLEFPILRDDVYIGAQATYELISFANENQELIIDGESTGIKPTGDAISILMTMGINF
ncbi:outer membrane beta-barrel protein [bacterium]|nr:outer membrane beta-barrel protein [bacterium]